MIFKVLFPFAENIKIKVHMRNIDRFILPGFVRNLLLECYAQARAQNFHFKNVTHATLSPYGATLRWYNVHARKKHCSSENLLLCNENISHVPVSRLDIS
jgi:hypothetical protein